MSLDGQAKWEKYFSNGSVETKTKSYKGSQTVWVFNQANSVFDYLESNHNVTVNCQTQYDPFFNVEYKKGNHTVVGRIHQGFLAKPQVSRGPTDRLLIKPHHFIEYGHARVIHGAPVRVFKSYRMLQDSIMRGLDRAATIDDNIQSIFSRLFYQDGNIEWGDIRQSDKRELGKCLGELLVGVELLRGNWNSFDIKPVDKVDAYCFPENHRHPGADGFLISGDKLTKISHKFGRGASASFFSNILPTAIKDGISDGIIGDLTRASDRAGVTRAELKSGRGSKKVLYEYMINDVMKLGIEDTSQIHQSIKSGAGGASILVVDAVRGLANSTISDQLPNSITSYFCREAADRLNNCQFSMSEARRILNTTNTWQAHMVTSAWDSGAIKYKMLDMEKAPFKFIGYKSALTDIDCGQGMINYCVGYGS